MASIGASVGRGGTNQSVDVKVVQRLLNKRGQLGNGDLTVDGKIGPKTIAAIRRFQAEVVGMRVPDERVDPGGRTMRRLNSGGRGAKPPQMSGSTPTVSSPSTARQRASGAKSEANARSNSDARRKFVRPSVKETAVTTRIINKIMPKFAGVKATVISGYLNDTDRFWKVNYHWELLLWMVDHCLQLPLDDRSSRRLSSIRSRLLGNAPDPNTGYRTSARVGFPADKSPMKNMDARVKILRQCKVDFKTATRDANLKSKSNRGARAFDLAAAPVVHPGTSKHGTGYALDIEGNNAQIKAISKGLGATVVFDEQSHVHVEFKNMA